MILTLFFDNPFIPYPNEPNFPWWFNDESDTDEDSD